jgi:hypothetical protein
MEISLGHVVADVSYQPGNSCNNLGDSIRNRRNNILALVILVSAGAEGYGDLRPPRT